MNTAYLGKTNALESNMNLYIPLTSKDKNFVMLYKNIVIQYREEQLTIPTEQLFEKLKELFKENKK